MTRSGLTLEELERRRNQAPTSVSIDPGSTRYLLDADHKAAKAAFEAQFEAINFEPWEPVPHSPAAGTTLQIIVTGVSLGAGIVATEMLKETGKKLWKSVEGLLSRKTAAEPAQRSRSSDHVRIELRVNGSTFQASVELAPGQDALLRQFLETSPLALYDAASKLLGNGQSCDGCKNLHRSPSEIPCRYCLRNGWKIKVEDSTLRSNEGELLDGKFDPAERREDFYIEAR